MSKEVEEYVKISLDRYQELYEIKKHVTREDKEFIKMFCFFIKVLSENIEHTKLENYMTKSGHTVKVHIKNSHTLIIGNGPKTIILNTNE